MRGILSALHLAGLLFVGVTHGTDMNKHVNVTFTPGSLEMLFEEAEMTIVATMHSDIQQNIYIQLSPEDGAVVSVTNDTNFLYDTWDTTAKSTYTKNVTFTVRGKFVGKTTLSVLLFNTADAFKANNNRTVFPSRYKVNVLRNPKALDTIFTIVVAVSVSINTIGFGCKLDLDVVKEILKKPVAPVVGLICQYAGMPMISFSIAKILKLPNELALGLFAIGCSPGGGASNIWSLLLDGDVSLSLTMTFISNVAALGLMPLWLFTLGQVFATDVTVPYVNIITSLISLVVPGIIGVLIGRFLPKVAKVIRKCVAPMSLILVLFIITAGVYTNVYMFLLMAKDWRVIIGGVLLPAVGYVIGCIAAFACCLPWYRVKTIMFETAIQNTGIAIVLLRFSLPQPDADLSSVMPVTATMFTPLPLLFIYIVKKIVGCCCGKPKDEDEDDEEEKEKNDKNDDIEMKSEDEETPKKLPKRLSQVPLTSL
ncbi:ileal sodium/bile acid cotransporter-like [Lingula anatina]|uniref:Ileal sodium/bile acid cotransporter-like n=1 Tax=Lingula anatina TaxID=7574 RepID=A0A1S3K2K7_LINAN|nr:ileal sodium/bile acid cotransporter-like [Lingula anatina]|eukprot:XP_013416873.1 ileal sodium/bile acid cotransporter-like [Lingula anatina]